MKGMSHVHEGSGGGNEAGEDNCNEKGLVASPKLSEAMEGEARIRTLSLRKGAVISRVPRGYELLRKRT
jgi:hypothetical protein